MSVITLPNTKVPSATGQPAAAFAAARACLPRPGAEGDLYSDVRMATALVTYGRDLAKLDEDSAALTAERRWVATRLAGLVRQIGAAQPAARAMAPLNALYRLGVAPEPAPSGFLRGELVSLDLGAALNRVALPIIDFGIGWKGKRLDPTTMSGINVLERKSRRLLRLIMPRYRHFLPDEDPNLLRAFPFKLVESPGFMDPDVRTLRIAYDMPPNPTTTVQRVIDEIVQLADGYYLGKANLNHYGAGWKTVAYFTLVA